MCYHHCIVCGSEAEAEPKESKIVYKVTCTAICKAVLLSWANIQKDGKPTLYQVYLNAISRKDRKQILLDEVE